jgi:Domain of unknown function (DUF4337)
MSELPHPEHESHASDPTGRRIGVIAAILAVALTVVTIASHRTHTRAIMDKSAANDQWSYYQSTRIKYHSVELGLNLLNTLGPISDKVEKARTDYEGQRKKYEGQSESVQHKAEELDHAAEADESRALRYDLGEGLLEIGLVLTSLYFISRRQMFPILGLIAAVLGIGIALTGLSM